MSKGNLATTFSQPNYGQRAQLRTRGKLGNAAVDLIEYLELHSPHPCANADIIKALGLDEKELRLKDVVKEARAFVESWERGSLICDRMPGANGRTFYYSIGRSGQEAFRGALTTLKRGARFTAKGNERLEKQVLRDPHLDQGVRSVASAIHKDNIVSLAKADANFREAAALMPLAVAVADFTSAEPELKPPPSLPPKHAEAQARRDQAATEAAIHELFPGTDPAAACLPSFAGRAVRSEAQQPEPQED